MYASEIRVYGKIKNIGDLVEMQNEANKHGLQAIGITDGGAMYSFDSVSGLAKTIAADKAKEILQFTDEEFAEFTVTRGDKLIASVVIPVVETPTLSIPEEALENEVIEVEEDIPHEVEPESTATFQEKIVEEASEVGETAKGSEEIPNPIVVTFHGLCHECEDCSVYTDKIALAKASINQEIEKLDDFKDYLQGLLKTLE